MQWLIDICVERVIADIGIPPVYVSRGDPAAWDFDKTDFTEDGTWRELDLSAIVPQGASAVDIKCGIIDNLVAKYAHFREPGLVHGFNCASIVTKLANQITFLNTTVKCSSDRKIEYYFANIAWDGIYFVVKGWWL